MTAQEQIDLALAWQRGDRGAGETLVRGHENMIRKLVYLFARTGVEIDDLMQEARMGFLNGAGRWESGRGAGVATVAILWAKARLYTYTMANGHQTCPGGIRYSTCEKDRKLFYYFIRSQRSNKETSLEKACEDLRLDPEKMRRSWDFLQHRPVELDALAHFDGLTKVKKIDRMNLTPGGAEDDLARLSTSKVVAEAVKEAKLDQRERAVIKERFGDKKTTTLQALGDRWGVSRERARQIEVSALKKIKAKILSRVQLDDLVAA